MGWDFLGDIVTGIGEWFGGKTSESKNREWQQKFAKHGIGWKVHDAVTAGLHPLTAVGAQTVPFQPVNSFGEEKAMSSMGQGINRAIHAYSTKEDRAMATEAKKLELERMKLDNMAKRQALQETNGGNNPGLPVPGDDGVISGAGKGANMDPWSYKYRQAGKIVQSKHGDEAGATGTHQLKTQKVGDKKVYYRMPVKDDEEMYSEGIMGGIRQIAYILNDYLSDDPPSKKYLKPGYKWKWYWTPMGRRWYAVPKQKRRFKIYKSGKSTEINQKGGDKICGEDTDEGVEDIDGADAADAESDHYMLKEQEGACNEL